MNFTLNVRSNFGRVGEILHIENFDRQKLGPEASPKLKQTEGRSGSNPRRKAGRNGKDYR